MLHAIRIAVAAPPCAPRLAGECNSLCGNVLEKAGSLRVAVTNI